MDGESAMWSWAKIVDAVLVSVIQFRKLLGKQFYRKKAEF
jgi:hypothetical protein